jgi:hypothetical protein
MKAPLTFILLLAAVSLSSQAEDDSHIRFIEGGCR